MAEIINPDYLVVGAGASAMAFVDTILSDTKATVAIVDRYSRPGGHWTVAYPFVTLHQPSFAYGVNSRELGEGKVDQVGLNKGYHEMATGDEILAYFGRVMRYTFLPSGRVTYHPQHEYVGDGEFRSITTKKVIRVGENTRIVDTTFAKVVVPATRPPAYEVSGNVDLVTPNDLATLSRSYGAYTVIGAGKTGADTCVNLLAQGIDPKNINWIMPRDSWFVERSTLQPPEINPDAAKFPFHIAETIMTASSSDDWFLRLEAHGHVLRVDQDIKPTMFRCAILSKVELDMCKSVGTIIRQGRVTRLDANEVTMEKGTFKPAPDTLFVDCTASAASDRTVQPIFEGRTITLQCVKFCQPIFSAAFIAHVEATYDSDGAKNNMCQPIPAIFDPSDWPVATRLSFLNRLQWMQEPKTIDWLQKARLELTAIGAPPSETETAEIASEDQSDMYLGLIAKLDQMIRSDASFLAV